MPRNFCQMAIKKRIMTAKVIGYMKPDIDPNTRLYVPFNEGVGNVAKDYSQYGNHAQLTDVEWSPDGFNGAGKFNGSSSYGDCGNDASLNITDAITIVIWMKSGTAGNNKILGKDSIHVGQNGWKVHYETNRLGMAIETDGITGWDWNGYTFTMAINFLDYVVFVYDGTKKRTYLNGNEEFNQDVTGNITTTNNNLLIGRHSAGLIYFNGASSLILIYNRAQSAAQITADCYEVVCS